MTSCTVPAGSSVTVHNPLDVYAPYVAGTVAGATLRLRSYRAISARFEADRCEIRTGGGVAPWYIAPATDRPTQIRAPISYPSPLGRLFHA